MRPWKSLIGLVVWASLSAAAPARAGCAAEDAAPAPAGAPPEKIAFVSHRDGDPEIYSVNVDGTGLERLTRAAGSDDEPAWSPDGQRIAFISDRSGYRELYVMDADGSDVVQRTFDSSYAEGPAWSPDGTRIAYSNLSNGSANVWAVSPDAGRPMLLLAWPGWDAHPAWSPDGSRLVLVSDWNAYDFVLDIFVLYLGPDGSRPAALTGNIFDQTDYLRPSWSPSGTKLAVDIMVRVGTYDYITTLGVMNPDGTGLTPLVPAVNWTTSSWSPDGLRIAFTSGTDAARDVSWVAADGSATGLIVSGGWNPSWRR